MNNKRIIAFRRKDDGEIFSLNDDAVTFSSLKMKSEFPDSYTHAYSKERLNFDSFEPVFE